jgi:hypothetical protein
MTAACLDSDPFLSANAEKEEQQEYYLLHSINYLLFDNDGPDLYHGAIFIKELENLIKNFEYTFDLDGSQIFPNYDIKQDIVNINDLNYELIGFKIIASDIKILRYMQILKE